MLGNLEKNAYETLNGSATGFMDTSRSRNTDNYCYSYWLTPYRLPLLAQGNPSWELLGFGSYGYIGDSILLLSYHHWYYSKRIKSQPSRFCLI